MFQELRAWQSRYAGKTGEQQTGNMFAPCPMRDHHEVARDVLVRLGARPMHEDAAHALADPEYARKMIAYGEEVCRQLDPVWRRDVVMREEVVAPRPGPAVVRPAARA